jgi:hypothetical protein
LPNTAVHLPPDRITFASAFIQCKYFGGNETATGRALFSGAHLDDSTRAKDQTLLANGSLPQAAIWPDQIRKTLPQFDQLHYMEVPRGAAGYDR